MVDPKDRITVDEVLAHPWCSTIKVGGPINGLVHEVPRLFVSDWFKSIDFVCHVFVPETVFSNLPL